MNFTTKIPLHKSDNPIDYSSSLVLVGSCFVENIGEKFNKYKFQNCINPFGIIFNPIAIENLINRAVNRIEFSEKDVFNYNNLWHCHEVHSCMSDVSLTNILEKLNSILQKFRDQIVNATHFIITYGTSWVYRNKLSNEIVANCHKVPQGQFTKEILSIDAITKSIQNTVKLIRKVNPECNFIFTISPVRHIKDGFVENQRSKAHLITSLQSDIIKQLNYNYFPSYEIMMDELRDYRFYADDMLHPSQKSIDYLWLKFYENNIAEKEFMTMKKVQEIQKALQHRPLNPESKDHIDFLKNLTIKINDISSEKPQIKF